MEQMRTKEQVVELSQKVLGLNAHFVEEDIGCFAVVGHLDTPEYAIFDKSFLDITDEEQEIVLQHELGHIVSTQKQLPGHSALAYYRHFPDYPLLAGYEIARAQSETEADLYAANKVGLKKLLRVMDKAMRRQDREVRQRDLKRAWKKQHKSWLSKLFRRE